MTIESGHSAFGAFRTARSSKLYWFNIDIVLRDIYFRHRSGWSKILEPEPQLALEYCVLEGVGAVGNALTVGTEGIDFDRFVVDISGYFEAEGFPTRDDLRPPARMVWNKIEERSPRLDIYIPNNLFRHLTELYITKRIDSLKMAMLIAVTGNNSDDPDSLRDGFPLLGESQHLFFPRVQCELLSVYASLGKH